MNLTAAQAVQRLLDAALSLIPLPEVRYVDPAELMPFERKALGLDERDWQLTMPMGDEQ